MTWQPERALRMALVTRQVSGKVVVAGQSLTPFENMDKWTQLVLTAGWLGSMLVLAASCAVSALVSRRRRPKPGSDGVGHHA
ncbi:hypothetical protein [Pseudarthrobacter phenanthrenivorans]|uniref:hypothetical protein n=1 Tax=Pseudarthrobacter phenanthrenivorans TaxID=361575 RepID=UPI002F351133